MLFRSVKSLAGSYLTELKVQDVTYDIGKIDIGGDVAFIGFPEIFITPSVKEYFYKE